MARDKLEFGGRNWQRNMPRRARDLLSITTRLGTTAIKIGQALSIRQDLLPAPYVQELSRLQDQVDQFPDAIAMQLVEKELRAAGLGGVDDVFSSFSRTPVAAASIGQVYKAELKDGTEVAVKVQRPDILESIALDLHMARGLAALLKKLTNTDTDLVGLVDEWGAGFVQELDYRREAASGKLFLEAMAARGLDAVTTAEAVEALSLDKLLVTKWVDGERLAESHAEDVGRLVGVAINAYLTMYLDIGLLHCDPHPGNFLRTPDGRLCILDFGMVTKVPEGVNYKAISYIAHLLSEDYEALPADMIALGFVPKGKEHLIQQAGSVEAMAFVLKQLGQGGGPKKLQERMERLVREEFGDLPPAELRAQIQAKLLEMNTAGRDDLAKAMGADGPSKSIADAARELEDLQSGPESAFQLPPWFAYILRTFSVLEGVGLASDPNYSITQECYPYLASRLFTDPDPRAQAALRSMLYGKDADKLDVERMKELVEGFGSFTSVTSSAQAQQGVEIAAAQATELLFSPQGNFIQQVVLEELAGVLDAAARQAFTASPLARLAIGQLQAQQQAATQLPAGVRAALAPLLFPGEVGLGLVQLLEQDEEDKETLAMAATLGELFGGEGGGLAEAQRVLGGGAGGVDGLRALLQRGQALPAGSLSGTSRRFAAVFLQRLAVRILERLDEAEGKAGGVGGVPPVVRGGAISFVDAIESLADSLLRLPPPASTPPPAPLPAGTAAAR